MAVDDSMEKNRFYKHYLGCRHLLSTEQEGVEPQTTDEQWTAILINVVFRGLTPKQFGCFGKISRDETHRRVQSWKARLMS